MQQTIWKYELKIATNEIEVQMPRRAAVLRVAEQGDKIFAWALVRPDEPMVRHRFRVLGTGLSTDEQTTWAGYRGTVFFFPSGIVLHFFDLGEPDDAAG